MLALVLAPGPAVASEGPELPPAKVRFLDVGAMSGALLLPAHEPPIGLVMLLPDRQDADLRSATYVEQFLGAGIAVFDVFQGEDDPADMTLGAAALSAEAGLRGILVGALGFGSGARQALGLGPGVAARVLLYPGCPGLAETAGTDPVLVLHGEGDVSNSADACADLAARLARGGRAVRRIGYAGAGYAWDYPSQTQVGRVMLPRPDGGGRVAALPWPELAELSATQATAFFVTSFLRRAQ
jgi:dienelactone hydrolase